MRPIVFSYPTQTAVEICATQTTTATSEALVLNGGLSNYPLKNTQGYSPIVVLPGIQRTVMISSTANISTSTFTISGIDTRGVAITTSIAGPTGTAIPVVTAYEFHKVTAVSVGTLASSPFTVGVGATGSSNWVRNNIYAAPFNMTISVVNTGTSPAVTVQDTPDDVNTNASPSVFSHATLVSVVSSQESNYAYPVNYVRAIFVATNAAATSSAQAIPQITFIQAG